MMVNGRYAGAMAGRPAGGSGAPGRGRCRQQFGDARDEAGGGVDHLGGVPVGDDGSGSTE